MTTLTDRLRGVLTPRATSVRDDAEDITPSRRNSDAASRMDVVAETLGGEWSVEPGPPFLIVDRKYHAGHRHGDVSILDSLPPDSGMWQRLSLLAGREEVFPASATGSPRRLVFLDLETTGLAGGAGTYAFLVGCAWFEGVTFRVRQFFLSSFSAERAILEAVSTLAGEAAAIITFNGKSFDIPLIDTRFALHRLSSPFEPLPHVDMLHVARRFWRRADEPEDDIADADGTRSRGCRLTELEQSVCGHQREGDVPGFEIPARYFHYVRSGDARGLEPVLEHNRLDLLSLALLTARAAQMLEDGPGNTTAREALGMGFLYERAGLTEEACSAYAYAAGMPGPDGDRARTAMREADAGTRAEALRAYALLARRERRFNDAASAWERVLQVKRCPPQVAREATEALAVHHEHRLRDLDLAKRFALQSLQYQSTPTRTQATHHRLQRLGRKMGCLSDMEALF